MVRYGNTLWCDGCGIEIRWVPRVSDNAVYCCEDCLNGLPCECDENEPEDNMSWLVSIQPVPKDQEY